MIFIFLILGNIRAQEREDNAWKAIFTDYSLTASTTLRLETHVRTRRFFTENDQYLIRPSIQLKWTKNAAITAGVTYIDSNTPLNRTIENNLWQQFSFSFPINRNACFGWIRLEERWDRKNRLTNYNTRIRFRTGLQFPLRRQTKGFAPHLIVFNEIFMILERGFPYRLNQNWTTIGFRQKISHNMRFFSGFQRATVSKKEAFLHKNIWSTTLFYHL